MNENDIPFLQLSISSSCAVCFLSLASLTQRSSHAWITQKKFNGEEWAEDFNPRCLLYSTLMLLLTVQYHLNHAPSCRDNSSVVRSCWEHGCFTSTRWTQSLAPNASPFFPHTQLLSVSLLVAWIQGSNYKWTEWRPGQKCSGRYKGCTCTSSLHFTGGWLRVGGPFCFLNRRRRKNILYVEAQLMKRLGGAFYHHQVLPTFPMHVKSSDGANWRMAVWCTCWSRWQVFVDNDMNSSQQWTASVVSLQTV